jgi:hypothetical protein
MHTWFWRVAISISILLVSPAVRKPPLRSSCNERYPKIARGKYAETIQFGWSTISEIFRSTTRLAST